MHQNVWFQNRQRRVFSTHCVLVANQLKSNFFKRKLNVLRSWLTSSSSFGVTFFHVIKLSPSYFNNNLVYQQVGGKKFFFKMYLRFLCYLKNWFDYVLKTFPFLSQLSNCLVVFYVWIEYFSRPITYSNCCSSPCLNYNLILWIRSSYARFKLKISQYTLLYHRYTYVHHSLSTASN